MTSKRRRCMADLKKRVAPEPLRERDRVRAISARYEMHPTG